jgi:predicted transposase/invertase (TIGR01784 family)
MDTDAAIKRAIDECIEKGVLGKFLKENSSTVLNMLSQEWKWEIALARKKEEGIAIGEAKGKAEAAKSMLAKGMSDALIAEITGLGKDEIEGLRQMT